MSLLKSQLKAAYAHIAKCESITNTIPSAGTSNYELVGLRENFTEIRASLDAIKPDIVEAHLRQNLNTRNVLDEHVSDAEYQLTTAIIGVFVRLTNLNQHFSNQGDVPSVLKLEKVRKYARKAVRVLHLMVHRKIAFLLSWRIVLLVVVIGLIAAAATYVHHYAVQDKGGQTASESVKAHASSDAEKIQTAAHSGSIDGAFNAVDSLLVELPKVPKAIIAITSSIAAIQALIIVVRKFRV